MMILVRRKCQHFLIFNQKQNCQHLEEQQNETRQASFRTDNVSYWYFTKDMHTKKKGFVVLHHCFWNGTITPIWNEPLLHPNLVRI